jgi:hypothetical protein
VFGVGIAEIDTQMPVILPPETHDGWQSGEAGEEVLQPFPAKEMKIRPVPTRVNKPENNDPGLLEQVVASRQFSPVAVVSTILELFHFPGCRRFRRFRRPNHH